jgi:hypothetical protein
MCRPLGKLLQGLDLLQYPRDVVLRGRIGLTASQELAMLLEFGPEAG